MWMRLRRRSYEAQEGGGQEGARQEGGAEEEIIFSPDFYISRPSRPGNAFFF
jgi:hypothetical protein